MAVAGGVDPRNQPGRDAIGSDPAGQWSGGITGPPL